MTDQLRAISYGGGVQSTALLVLAAQQRIDYPLAIMACLIVASTLSGPRPKL